MEDMTEYKTHAIQLDERIFVVVIHPDFSAVLRDREEVEVIIGKVKKKKR